MHNGKDFGLFVLKDEVKKFEGNEQVYNKFSAILSLVPKISKMNDAQADTL